MPTPAVPRPVVLCVLDGWGCRAETTDNAIKQARTPNLTAWLGSRPLSRLDASGTAVGLPEGQMGNSEVGHMSIGAGRVVMQELPRIDQAIKDGSLDDNATLLAFTAKLKRVGGACHLLGLLSPGGVHSHQRHLAALAILIARQGVPVFVHAFLDGRDTPPKSAEGYLRQFLEDVAPEPLVKIGSVSGRYYAMDRDKRWDRVARAYNAMVMADAPRASDPLAGLAAAYEAGKTDEFVEPFVLEHYPGMKDDDGVLMGNFRGDRAREILRALLIPDFADFERPRVVRFEAAAGMVAYADDLNPLMPALFPPNDPHNSLGEIVADAGLKQLRIAETEKYAHVTFFLNGGREMPFPGEERILVPSPKVATYDLQPEMSAPEVTEKLVGAIDSGKFDLIVVNYANPDMVGHTGIMDAAVKAVETIDGCLTKVADAVARAGGALLITADHGNIEMMRDPVTHEPHTAHTTNLVPFMLLDDAAGAGAFRLENGILADVAPTVLELMGLPKPAAMTGHSLILKGAGDRRARA
jgi:2,3-bisphosphoglycerate-independent phosphoglycerate mutase